MKARLFPLTVLSSAAAQTVLPPPHFHHLALNSTDPDAAITSYQKEFPSPARADHARQLQDPTGARSLLALTGPAGGASINGVALNWYMNQTDRPLAPTLGHLMDHVALSVSEGDAWIAKLERERVFFSGNHITSAPCAR